MEANAMDCVVRHGAGPYNPCGLLAESILVYPEKELCLQLYKLIADDVNVLQPVCDRY